MIKTPFKLVLNTILLSLLVGMLVLPVALVHVVTGTAHVPATVAGAQKTNENLIVLPNFFDFSDHVSFSPEYVGYGYKDVLTLTSFRSQVATYHKLYTVYNRSADPITVRGVLGEKPSPETVFDSLVITMAKSGQEHSTKLARPAVEGDVSLIATDASVAEGADYVVIEKMELPVLSVTGRFIATDPLPKSLAQGDVVYRSGIFVADGKVYRSRTPDVVIAPGESITVNAVVVGKADVETGTVTIPFFILGVN